ncbi:MAG: alpha/beta fold hydrolase [Chlorobium limicola]|jgi:carboxylesterase|nr:alpha/beta fold hydrolase [Chlorobium limicola]NTV08715.1 alpha/beta fold hydrolase [Chlorobium limicola]NTV21627.1 alpha/beta fold hydrolase [Chlorobium limicola]
MPQRQQRAPIGVLMIHGFTATPESFAVLEKPLQSLGVPIRMPLLAGHGTPSPEALIGVTFHEWMADAAKAFQQLSMEAEKIVIIGHSMGALISLQLAEKYPSTVDSLVLAAPALKLFSLLAPGRLMHFSAPFLARIIKKWDIKPVFAGPDYVRCAGQYAWAPTDAILSLFELIVRTSSILDRVRVPVLILHNRNETTVLPESADHLYRHIGSASDHKKIVWLEHSEHQIFCDCEREKAATAVLDFVADRLGVQ